MEPSENSPTINGVSSDSVLDQSKSAIPLISDDQLGLPDDKLQAITIYETYLELMAAYNPNLLKGVDTFNPWQVEVDEFVSKFSASAKHPLKFCLCAANGSGKDSFFVAPFAVWKVLSRIKATVVITSSSGPQLTNQTERYIRNLCEAINAYWQNKIFKVNQRHIKCLLTGSEIILFATDEAGRAEGYHPLESGRELVLIANECKSVKDEIFAALGRCTGYTHYIMVSSPGEPKGDFYWAFTHWPNSRRVTSKECHNLNDDDRKQDEEKFGASSAYYRSKHLALFTTVGGTVVINEDVYEKCKSMCQTWVGKDWPKRVGIDLAAGGDETVISIWQGNRQIYQYAFIEKDTTTTADIIVRELRGQGLTETHEYIKADDGGVGRGVIDQLKRRGWVNIRRIMNQTPAFNKREFGNKGAEMWFNLARLMQEGLIMLEGLDSKLKSQLVARHYKQTTGGNNRTYLQDKKEAKAHGHPSPDRADAMTLALEDVKVQDFLDCKTEDGKTLREQIAGPVKVISMEEFKDEQEESKFQYFDEVALGHFANAELLRHRACSSNVSALLDKAGMLTVEQAAMKIQVNGSLDAALDL